MKSEDFLCNFLPHKIPLYELYTGIVHWVIFLHQSVKKLPKEKEKTMLLL